MNSHKGTLKGKCVRCGHKKIIYNSKSKKLYCAKCKTHMVFREEKVNSEEVMIENGK